MLAAGLLLLLSSGFEQAEPAAAEPIPEDPALVDPEPVDPEPVDPVEPLDFPGGEAECELLAPDAGLLVLVPGSAMVMDLFLNFS